MRVGVDLDGVVSGFSEPNGGFVHYLNSLGHTQTPPPQTWEFWTEWGLSFEEFKEHFANGVEAGIIFHCDPLLPGARQGINSLKRAGHTIHIVTDRQFPRAPELTMGWLTRHGIPYDSITFSRDKTIVDVDAYIDDRVENVRDVRAVVPPLTKDLVVLRDRPWNRYDDKLPRVTSWRQFVRLVNGWSKGER